NDVADSLSALAARRPGLAMLVRQVFAKDLVIPQEKAAVIKLENIKAENLTVETAPLPNEIASQRLTQVIVGAMGQQELSTADIATPVGAAVVAPHIPEKLKLEDFESFGNVIASQLIRPYQRKPGVLETSPIQGCIPGKEGTAPKINFGCLLTAY